MQNSEKSQKHPKSSLASYVENLFRSSRPEVFCKKGVLRNFAKLTGKHLCQELFFNKVAGLRPDACKFIKKEALAQVFSCEIFKISKNNFFHRTPLVAVSDLFKLKNSYKKVVSLGILMISGQKEVNQLTYIRSKNRCENWRRYLATVEVVVKKPSNKLCA